MEWATFLAAVAGGGVSIMTAWLTNRAQFKRDEAARFADQLQDHTEYSRRKQENIHEAIHSEVHTVIDAATNAQRITQLMQIREKDMNSFDIHFDFLEHLYPSESYELAEGYAKASASSRRLFLIDQGLGRESRLVAEQLDPPEPVFRDSDVVRYLERLSEAARHFIHLEKERADGR